jgi:hypothetical protein
LPRSLTLLAAYAVTLFVSATLLFLVQPMVGKLILPFFGGTPAVWNTCMVFFQAMLLAGYTYAHFTTRWLGVRRQALLHLVVLPCRWHFSCSLASTSSAVRCSAPTSTPRSPFSSS